MRPISMRMVVVLPEPFGPRKPKTLPARDGEVEPVDGELLAVALGERARLDDVHRRRTAAAARHSRPPSSRSPAAVQCVVPRNADGAAPAPPSGTLGRAPHATCAAFAAFTSASLVTAPT